MVTLPTIARPWRRRRQRHQSRLRTPPAAARTWCRLSRAMYGTSCLEGSRWENDFDCARQIYPHSPTGDRGQCAREILSPQYQSVNPTVRNSDSSSFRESSSDRDDFMSSKFVYRSTPPRPPAFCQFISSFISIESLRRNVLLNSIDLWISTFDLYLHSSSFCL